MKLSFKAKDVTVDYTDEETAAGYIKSHGNFRDFRKEAERVFSMSGAGDSSHVIELGCGPGNISLELASLAEKIIAVDPSPAMIKLVQKRTREAGITNLETQVAGFLDFTWEEGEADLVLSKFALHHLPDFWKQQAIARIARSLKPGGGFYLNDVIFTEEIALIENKLEEWYDKAGEFLPPQLKKEMQVHVEEEYSTFDWILEGMLKRAGFDIVEKAITNLTYYEYFCRKPPGSE